MEEILMENEYSTYFCWQEKNIQMWTSENWLNWQSMLKKKYLDKSIFIIYLFHRNQVFSQFGCDLLVATFTIQNHANLIWFKLYQSPEAKNGKTNKTKKTVGENKPTTPKEKSEAAKKTREKSSVRENLSFMEKRFRTGKGDEENVTIEGRNKTRGL